TQAALFDQDMDSEAKMREYFLMRFIREQKNMSSAKAEKARQDFMFAVLRGLHEAGSRYIRPLFDGKTVKVFKWGTEVLWSLHDGELKEETDEIQGNDLVQELCARLTEELIDFIRSSRPVFPFRQCPVCEKVFVPVKVQKYCSPNCAYQGI